jgi:hypothetical protein
VRASAREEPKLSRMQNAKMAGQRSSRPIELHPRVRARPHLSLTRLGLPRPEGSARLEGPRRRAPAGAVALGPLTAFGGVSSAFGFARSVQPRHQSACHCPPLTTSGHPWRVGNSSSSEPRRREHPRWLLAPMWAWSEHWRARGFSSPLDTAGGSGVPPCAPAAALALAFSFAARSSATRGKRSARCCASQAAMATIARSIGTSSLPAR